ncbi:hypothetical protein KO498_01615 [Lentibacter algarum]|uniref:hypothetical protein n=1 Tax=Lentibacter algarum TaxID=576131 RepID=UPI001C07AC83|nr:hypothetical protein [Lentibacter algarum]MBU2980499.1 hypothetical protein [Lentibacter algarum]
MQAAAAQTPDAQSASLSVPAAALLVCLVVVLLSAQSSGQGPYDTASAIQLPPHVTVSPLKP